MPTLTITNLGGPLTRRNTGDINSGLAKFDTSWGYDPYSKPGNLTWLEQPTSILTGVLPMAIKQRTEGTGNNIANYAYTIANDGNLYKLTISSPSGPDIDTSSMISIMDPDSYAGGGGITFYGTTEKIFLGGDRDIQKVNFNGSSPSVIGTTATDLPRPFANFLGKIYFGNGNNIGEIDSTDTIVTMSKLSPALETGLIVKDLDVTPDGNYLQIIASRTNPLNATGGGSTSGDTASFNASDSYKFYWNGIDAGITSINKYDGLTLSANVNSSGGNYLFGYDRDGAAVFSGEKKVVSIPETLNPLPNAVFSTANRIFFAAPEYIESTTRFVSAIYNYGQYDEETPAGLFRLLRQSATVREDVVAIPTCLNVSNRMHLQQQFGQTNNLVGSGKIYYSVSESPSVIGAGNIFKLWRFNTAPTNTSSVLAGVYETQNQLFSKKVSLGEVRLYTEPLVANNAFTLAVLNSGSSIIAQNTYTVGGNVSAGEDLVRFKPEIASTPAIGFRITNSGSANWTGLKIEADYENAGT